MKNKVAAIMVAAAMVASLAACGSSSSSTDTSAAASTAAETAATTAATAEDAAATTTEAASGDVKTIKIGVSTESMPNAYVDENGNMAGENYEVMQLVDKLLPDYQFEYEAVSQETILLGLDSGTYQAGISNFFYNDERAEKYLYPTMPISGGVRGLILRTEDQDKFTEGTSDEVLTEFAKLGYTMVPVGADESAYTMFTEYNNTHDDKINFEVTEETDVSTSISYIMQKRYDGSMFLESNYDAVKDQVDPDGVTYFLPFTDGGFGTWALYGKDQQELVDAVDGAMKQLYEDGTMAAISEKYYGENVFQYIPDFEYADVEPNPDYNG